MPTLGDCTRDSEEPSNFRNSRSDLRVNKETRSELPHTIEGWRGGGERARGAGKKPRSQRAKRGMHRNLTSTPSRLVLANLRPSFIPPCDTSSRARSARYLPSQREPCQPHLPGLYCLYMTSEERA